MLSQERVPEQVVEQIGDVPVLQIQGRLAGVLVVILRERVQQRIGKMFVVPQIQDQIYEVPCVVPQKRVVEQIVRLAVSSIDVGDNQGKRHLQSYTNYHAGDLSPLRNL